MDESMPAAQNAKRNNAYFFATFNKRVAFVKWRDFVGPRIHKGIFGTAFSTMFTGGKIWLFGNIHLGHTFTYNDFAAAMINVGMAATRLGSITARTECACTKH